MQTHRLWPSQTSCKRGREDVILLGKMIIYFFQKMQMGSTDLGNKDLKTVVLFIPFVLS